jgi:glycerol uptake facilitator-like aquaporin
VRHTGLTLLAEFAGTALLVCVVVGSGIMGDQLSADDGVALIINTLSTIFALTLLIFVLVPVSGAHMNPAVSITSFLTRDMRAWRTLGYIIAQIAGAIVGAIVANVMFDLPPVTLATNDRVTFGTLVGEVLATAGLIVVIGVLARRRQLALVPLAVATWIGSAAFFTSSASFANPAVTIGRMFTDTFAGIAPGSVLPYVAAQLIGALLGLGLMRVIPVRHSETY